MNEYIYQPKENTSDKGEARRDFIWHLVDAAFTKILYSKYRQLIKLALVIVLCGIGLLARLIIAPLDAGLPFLSFFPIIALCAIMLGIWPGLVATALCSFLAAFFFYPPYLSLSFTSSQKMLLPLSALVIDGILISVVIGVVQHHFWRKIKEEFDKKNDEFGQVVEMAPNALIMTSQAGVIEMANRRAEEIFGYARGEIIGQSIEILLPENLRHEHVKSRGEYVHNPTPRAMGVGRDLQARHKDGHQIPVEIALNPIGTKHGVRVLAAIIDISERKRQQEELIQTNERFSIASSAAGLGFWEYDLSTNTLLWDQWMFNLYGLEHQSNCQSYALWTSHVHPSDLAITEEKLQHAILGLTPFECTFRIYRSDGEMRYVKASAFVVRNKDGAPQKVVGINIDVTDSCLAEARQQQLISELENINAELTNFTYVASHDLKSPLRGIHQIASWVTEDLAEVMDEPTKENLRLMRSRIVRMERLLDDLLIYSRVGRTDDDIVLVNTAQMIRDVFEFTVDTRPFVLTIIGDIPDIYTRKTPLELIFRNLIGNAIKHHHQAHGTIHVNARMHDALIEFTVKDDGPGIPLEHHERAFAIFQTLKPRDVVEGSGIGLALIKKTVEAAGGKVVLESDGQSITNSGCTFRFTWPASLSTNRTTSH
jgi:PAS domain S-box-containing protein